MYSFVVQVLFSSFDISPCIPHSFTDILSLSIYRDLFVCVLHFYRLSTLIGAGQMVSEFERFESVYIFVFLFLVFGCVFSLMFSFLLIFTVQHVVPFCWFFVCFVFSPLCHCLHRSIYRHPSTFLRYEMLLFYVPF